jgi:hypothetical protein
MLDLILCRSVVGFGIGQAASYQTFLNDHGRASIGLVPTLILQELWLTYSFLSATVPCLRPLLGAFNSGALLMTAPGGSSTQRSGYASRSIALETFKRSFRGTESEVNRKTSAGNLRPDEPFYGVNIGHDDQRVAGEGASLASDGSEQMIIRRDTQIRIHVES